VNPSLNSIDTKTELCQSCGLDRKVAREILSEPIFLIVLNERTCRPQRIVNENRDLAEKAVYGCEECRKVLGLDD
jgi:hypothetical protein